MRQKFFTTVAAATLMAFMIGQVAFGQAAAPQKTWKDGEYDLANPALSDQNAQSRLGKLDAWKAKFPASDFDTERRQAYLATYQALNKPAEVFATAKEILAKDPDNLAALTAPVFFINRFTPAPSTDNMAFADQVSATLLANGDKYFSPDKKPKGVTDDQWNQAKNEIMNAAQNNLAWTAMQSKDWEKAEAEYTKLLKMQPTNLQATYSLATVILNQKKIDKLPLAIFHLGRAANYDGTGALKPDARKSIEAYYEKQYINYHGDKTDIDAVTTVAKANVFPPDGFHIKSVVEIAADKEAAEKELNSKDPALGMWKTLREALSADGGQAYFDGSVKGAGLPGGANGVEKFKGKLVSATPELNPKELVLGIIDPKVGEVTLKLDAPLRGKMEPGADIEFEGVPTSFTKDPFMLNFDVEKAKIKGWTAGPAAPIRRVPPKPKK